MKKTARILLVDDTDLHRELFSRYLEQLGYPNVQEAGDGRQALQSVASYQPHLVLMDTQMPGPYGPEVSRQIRQTERGKMIGIIGMTDNDDPTYRDTWLEAGADEFLKKGDIFASRQVLDDAIQKVLKKYEMQQ